MAKKTKHTKQSQHQAERASKKFILVITLAAAASVLIPLILYFFALLALGYFSEPNTY
jgi:hypothetical protein